MLKVFIKTFVICLTVLFVWTAWSMFKGDGFEDIPDVRTEVYSKPEAPKNDEENEEREIIKATSIYFLNLNNEIVEVKRDIKNPSLERSIKELFNGTTNSEKTKGLYSEIPSDTKLIGISTYSNKIIVNVNSKFIKGGGTTTIINRIKQLKKTVDAQSGKKPIYLQVEGKQVEYIGGDGVYLEQPLNEDML